MTFQKPTFTSHDAAARPTLGRPLRRYAHNKTWYDLTERDKPPRRSHKARLAKETPRETARARDEIRPGYRKIAEARAATEMPRDPDQLSLYRTIFPQMTNWLPTQEAAQLSADFQAKLTRLTAA